ncbi:AAA family ATPase [Candidatus Woesearchaeota archaeon]|nr:AAA family ATPase [Candidatus Woesearchaeota archaeon]
MNIWYKQLGFKENPLDLRPNTKLVGLERQEETVLNHIEKGEICFLQGLTGSGKSSLLMRVQKKLLDHAFIYVDAQELPLTFDLEEALKDARTLIDRISLKEYPSKPAVLIIDEFQATTPTLVLEARAKWENPNERKIKSIIFAQISKQLKNVTPAFKERLGNRIITLPTLDDSEMKEILKLRLENKRGNFYNRLHNETINLLVACADGNPRRLLEYADILFDFHHRKFGDHNPLLTNRAYLINYYGARDILSANGINTNSYIYLSPDEKKRGLEEFNKRFSKEEQGVISSLMAEPKTFVQLAEEFKLSRTKAQALVKSLRRKKGVSRAGKSKGQQLWQASQHAKRLTVNE